MDTSGQSDTRARGRGTHASASSGPLELITIAARLDAIDAAMAGFDRRLRALEAWAPIAAPAPPAAAPPAMKAPSASTPQPDPTPAAGFASARRAAARRLLDGEPLGRGGVDAPTAQASPAAPARSRRLPAVSLPDLERAVSGRGLAWAGGLALIVGALFFFSLAISRGWIGPELRVVIGIVAGLAVTGLGDRLMRGGDRILGPVLVAVGIGVWNLALVAGTRLYGFVPAWAALAGAAASAVVAASIAIRANAQVIALYGMATALAAPMLFAVPPERTPMPYLVVVLAGAAAISIARGWAWLPPVAFVLSMTQFWDWWRAADAPQWAALLAIVGLCALHLSAAAGAWLRASAPAARIGAILVLVANAIAFANVGFGALGDEEIRLGAYLLGGVAAHAAAGAIARRRTGEAAAFVNVAFAIAAVLFTIAIPVVFDGPAVAIAWGAEAVGLVWLGRRFRSAGALGAAAMVYALGVAHLFILEYEAVPGRAPRPGEGMIPFANDGGLALLGLLAALVAAGVILRGRLARAVLAMAGFGVVIAALPYELAGLPLMTGWALLAVLALALGNVLATRAGALPGAAKLAWVAANGLHFPAAIAAGLAVRQAVLFEMPVFAIAQIGVGTLSAEPLIATGVIVAAALAAAWVTNSDQVRQVAGSTAILVVANLAAYLLAPALAVAAWSALVAGAAFLQRRIDDRFRLLLLTGGVLLALGVAVTLVGIAPPTRLLVTAGAAIGHPFLWSEATLALGALAAACFAVAHRLRATPAAVWLALGGGVLATYLLSVGIVDAFQARIDGEASVAELRWQSQMALSVVWAVLGGFAVAVGLARGVAPMRAFGLGLLGLATAKVFLYDLASLDAVYRVLSFLVLGVLLLLSSYAYRRFGAAPDDQESLETGALEGDRGQARLR